MNKGNSITIRELAKKVKVSISTVSKALSDSDEISIKTKKRVRRAAKAYGYTPSYIAQSLKLQKTRTIGVIVPNILDEFFAKVFHGIEKEASKHKYRIVVCISNEKLRKEKECVATLISTRVDAILVSLSKETQLKERYDHFEKIVNKKIPLVMFDRTCDAIKCDKVFVDDFNAAYKATKYLLFKKYNNIAFLSTISNTSVGKFREKGYSKAIESKRVCSKSMIINIDNYDNFERTLGEYLKHQTINAILAADELSAVYTMNILRSHGMQVPYDCSVIGFTNGTLAKYSSPTLTTVNQHAETIGKTATAIAIKRIEGDVEGSPIDELIKTRLVIRDSTRRTKMLVNI